MIRIRNRQTKQAEVFMDQKAVLNNATRGDQKSGSNFGDQTALINNARSGKQKIALPEEFTAQTKDKPQNEYVEYNKTSELKINSAVAKRLEAKAIQYLNKGFKPLSNDDRLNQEIYKYESVMKQHQQEHKTILGDIASRTENYIKQFAGFANNSIFQNLVGLAARVVAPPPDANQILAIKDRIRRLDTSLMKDIYTISQIIQSPELMAYIRSLYDHVKNMATSSTELNYIMNLIKPIIDYISINSDRFSMSSSQWLLDVYQKMKGTFYTPPVFTPETPAPMPVTTGPTTFNFQSDSNAPPSERHADIPTSSQTVPAPITEPAPAPPNTPVTASPTEAPIQPLVGNMLKLLDDYKDAFSTRAKLEAFYLMLQSNLGTLNGSLQQIRLYVQRYPISAEQMRNTATETLTTTLINALKNQGTMPQFNIQELQTRANLINNDETFFFQPLKTSQEQTPTQDYSELRNKVNMALENREKLEIFIADIVFKPEYLSSYPIFKNYVIKETDSLSTGKPGEDVGLWTITTKILFDIIYNGLVSLNDPVLNSDYIPSVGNEMNRLVNDPKFDLAPGDTPEIFTKAPQRMEVPKPYSGIAPKPEPQTITPATAPTATPQMNLPSEAGGVPVYISANKPTALINTKNKGLGPIDAGKYIKAYASLISSKSLKNIKLFEDNAKPIKYIHSGEESKKNDEAIYFLSYMTKENLTLLFAFLSGSGVGIKSLISMVKSTYSFIKMANPLLSYLVPNFAYRRYKGFFNAIGIVKQKKFIDHIIEQAPANTIKEQAIQLAVDTIGDQDISENPVIKQILDESIMEFADVELYQLKTAIESRSKGEAYIENKYLEAIMEAINELELDKEQTNKLIDEFTKNIKKLSGGVSSKASSKSGSGTSTPMRTPTGEGVTLEMIRKAKTVPGGIEELLPRIPL